MCVLVCLCACHSVCAALREQLVGLDFVGLVFFSFHYVGFQGLNSGRQGWQLVLSLPTKLAQMMSINQASSLAPRAPLLLANFIASDFMLNFLLIHCLSASSPMAHLSPPLDEWRNGGTQKMILLRCRWKAVEPEFGCGQSDSRQLAPDHRGLPVTANCYLQFQTWTQRCREMKLSDRATQLGNGRAKIGSWAFEAEVFILFIVQGLLPAAELQAACRRRDLVSATAHLLCIRISQSWSNFPRTHSNLCGSPGSHPSPLCWPLA